MIIAQAPSATDNRRPVSPARRFYAACDRFEAAWRGGQDPPDRELPGSGRSCRAGRRRGGRRSRWRSKLRQGAGATSRYLASIADRFPGQLRLGGRCLPREHALWSGISPPRSRSDWG